VVIQFWVSLASIMTLKVFPKEIVTHTVERLWFCLQDESVWELFQQRCRRAFAILAREMVLKAFLTSREAMANGSSSFWSSEAWYLTPEIKWNM
jgi:hypothetical protein